MGDNKDLQQWVELVNKLVDNFNTYNEKFNKLESKLDKAIEEINTIKVNNAVTKTQVGFWNTFWGLAGTVISVITAIIVYLVKMKGN
jgi:predicted PurR-regulated permease PerM